MSQIEGKRELLVRPRDLLLWCTLIFLLVSVASCGVPISRTVETPEGGDTAQVRSIAGPAGARPNVLLITIDTLRADHLGAYGNTRVKTPNFDALARSGARFDTAIAQFSQTNPSHASLFTGTYVATHKVRVHGIDTVAPSVTTLAEAMRDQGYATAGVYSWPSFDAPMSGLDRGFLTYQGVYFDVPGKEGHPDFWRKFGARADITTDAAIQWLAGNASRPFFLWIHYQDPHYPFVPPAPFDKMYEPLCQNCSADGWNMIDRIGAGEILSELEIAQLVAQYDGTISFTDHEIGRLLQWMRDAKVSDNTLVIATADHGESFNDNGRWFHPFILYNSVLRVPLIMRYTPAIPEGVVVDSVTQSIDVMPTILDLVGAPHPGGIEGRTLWPLLVGAEKGDDRIAVAELPDESGLALIAGGWKIIKDLVSGEVELYDLIADPGERINLASANPSRLAEMETRLKAWMDSHGIRP
ncbi:MAG: sulfatase [Chloroflexi bacterium]|nr:sulfatase [Chloroflexota bacterium]